MRDEAAPPVIIPTNYRRIDEFDDILEDWIQYTEKLNHYFIANNIESMEKQRAILLSACGKKTYKLMGNLSAPQKPGEKTYDDIVKLVKDHQHPKPSSIEQRCKFNSRLRQPNELVSQFVAELRQISEHCDYKATLDDMLRDSLVCGIKEDRIQRHLLAKPGLTFKKAMEVATAMEMATKNAHDLCGGSHNATDCKWKDAKCYVCDKKGHLAKKNAEIKGSKMLKKNRNLSNKHTIVPIVKPDKSVRICGDYKVSINQVSKLDNYPIPKTDDLYATLSGGQAFCKLDLSLAYQQIVLDEESRKYVTINTHKGLYQYNRLPFGVLSAPGVFQRTMENLL
ncbi:Hypothetical predicted protein [Mytilus galloprovincialis]|uniref:Reverse transcriptase domain-containing protein n=1 Tax=Mytilus galloprovincialis TaxID=29158 RepID=A0A8B6G426_MYTGA|nr:Hypothetical predicted protein [Mytilus galloprovincialis]